MKAMQKYFYDMCKQKYCPLGFKKINKSFARINGDVLQSFTFLKRYRAPVISIEFGIFPLCMPTPIFIEAGGYELDRFVVEIYEKNAGWLFDPNSSESIKKCIDSVLDVIDFYLLPFFDACSDCCASLRELRKLEEVFEINRQKVLHLQGEADCAIPLEERSLFDSRKYYMALKTKDVQYARRYLQHQIDWCKKRLHTFNCPNTPKQPAGVIESFLESVKQYACELERLEAGDWKYFDETLCCNEKMMEAYIATKYPKIWNS